MRVLLVSEFVPPVRGGLEAHVAALAGELGRRGHAVEVATLTADPEPVGQRVHPVRGLAQALPHESPDRPFHPPLPDPVVRRQLSRVIADFGPDVIHAHNWLAASLPRSAPPVVMTLHDYSLICHLRTLFDSAGEPCDGPAPVKCWLCGRHQLGAARSAVMAPATVLGRRLLGVRRYVAVSSAVAAAVGPYLRAPVSVVPNFVAPEPPAEPLPAGFPSGRYVLYAGDPGAHKGLDVLLEAWRAQPLPGVHLVVASTRPVALPGVYSTSLTPGQMATAWRGAICGVVPSRWPEPCPTVVLEARRAGVPVVASRVGGIPDLVTDGEDGLLVPPGDAAALAAALARIEQVPGPSTVEPFTVASVVDRLVREYADALR